MSVKSTGSAGQSRNVSNVQPKNNPSLKAKAAPANTQAKPQASSSHLQRARSDLHADAMRNASDGDATEALAIAKHGNKRNPAKTQEQPLGPKSAFAQSMDEAKDNDADEVSKKQKKRTREDGDEQPINEKRIKRDEDAYSDAGSENEDNEAPVSLLDKIRARKATVKTEAIEQQAATSAISEKQSAPGAAPKPTRNIHSHVSVGAHDKAGEISQIFASSKFRASAGSHRDLLTMENKAFENSATRVPLA